jgi:hypothetical protein
MAFVPFESAILHVFEDDKAVGRDVLHQVTRHAPYLDNWPAFKESVEDIQDALMAFGPQLGPNNRALIIAAWVCAFNGYYQQATALVSYTVPAILPTLRVGADG